MTLSSPDDRGYGYSHRKMRARLIAELKANPGLPCSRCHKPMYAEQKLHLDHDDVDRSKYRGLSHARCNQLAAHYSPSRRKNPFAAAQPEQQTVVPRSSCW
jgi:hypothetical protein